MSTLTILLAAAALAAGATPAVAAPDAPVPTAKAQASRYAVRYDAKNDQYCVRDRQAVPETGTRLVPQECKSRSQWAALGLNIERKN